MEHREDHDGISMMTIHNSIGATDHFANLGLVELRNDPARVWKASQLLDRSEEMLNDDTCVMLRVSRDEVLNGFEILYRLKRPTNADHEASRALTSS